jgi:hypothetical protein
MTHDGGGAVYENLLFAGLLLVVIGIASQVVPIPHSETPGIKSRGHEHRLADQPQ